MLLTALGVLALVVLLAVIFWLSDAVLSEIIFADDESEGGLGWHALAATAVLAYLWIANLLLS